MKIRFLSIRLCFLLSFILSVLTSTGQVVRDQYGISPQNRLEDCAIDQWTGDNGLLSNNLTSVIQAKSGFLWITTNNGLMRFDGTRLEIFDQGELPFLSTDAFYKVYEDKHGALWFATRGNGIIRYANNTFAPYLPDNSLIPKSLRTLLILDDGTIYAGSENKGLIVLRDSIVKRIDDPLINDAGILALDVAADGSIMIGTNNKGLLKYHHGKLIPVTIEGRNDQNINAIKCLPDGRILAGTTEGLFAVQGENSIKYDFLKNVEINHITVDHFGSIWIGSERGLARIHEKLQKQEFLRSGRDFPGAHITSIYPDREGSLWLSTGKSGLLRLKETPIRTYNENHGLSVDRVNVVAEAPDGKFYVCLDDGFVNVFDNGVISDFSIESKVWDESIRDILVEQDGTAWIASYNGLIKKTKTGEKVLTTADGLSSNSVRRVFKDTKGHIWLGTRSGGVMQMQGERVLRTFDRKSGMSSNYILSIEEDKLGNMLIGTHSGGLNIILPDGRVQVDHVRPDDDGVLIFNVDVDAKNEVFVATSVGLFHYDRNKRSFIRIELADVAKGESYFDWVEDKLGNVWITTNIGILQLRKADVVDFLAGKINSVKSKIFNDYDGMRNKECTGATRSTLSSKGEIWVPTIEGISVINPYNLRDNSIVPQVYITEVITDKMTIPNPSDKIVVEPGNFRISVNFTATSLRAPNKVKFRYRLDNIDADWKSAEPMRRSVDYTNLPPGNYTFQVKAANNDGIWNEMGVRLFIVVKPFYYQTAWFYIVVIAVLMIAFVMVYKWRVSAIEQKNAELLKLNRELDRFVYSASHDLRAPLTSILGLVKLTRIDNDPQNRLQYLDMVERSIHKLDGFIHDIINYSRNSRTELKAVEVNFHELVNGIIEALRYQDKSQKIRKDVQVTGTCQFFTDAKRLEIVMVNLVSNAIKYHNTLQDDPFIRIKVVYNQQNCVIDVIDNGSGIDKDHLENIFKMFYRADDKSTGSGLGLFIAKETVEKLKGTLTVKSVAGKGSTFRIHIPNLVSHLL